MRIIHAFREESTSFLPLSADVCAKSGWHSRFANGSGLFARSCSFSHCCQASFETFWNIFFTLAHTENDTLPKLFGELSNTLLLGSHTSSSSRSEMPLGVCTSSSPHLPLDNCKDTNVPHQGSCLKEQDLSLASAISECTAWKDWKAKSQITQ